MFFCDMFMNSVADELNIKSRIVPLNSAASEGVPAKGESEHSVMLPLEIDEGEKVTANA